MPYHLMTDEHMRERMAAGDAQQLASTPAESVLYDGARWTRTGDMWVLDDSSRARPGTAKSSAAASGAADSGTAETCALAASGVARVELTAADHGPAGAWADQVPGAPVPDDAGGRRRGRRILVSAACLAGLSSVALVSVVLINLGGDDRTQPTAAPVAVPSPSALPETSPYAVDPSVPAVPLPEDTARTPAAPTQASGAVPSRTTRPAVEPPRPSAPASPKPASSAPPTPPAPSPTAQPTTPASAAADLEVRVNLVWQAGQLSDRGRAQMLRRADQIQDAVADDDIKRVRRTIDKMLREMDDIRERGELTIQGEDVLERAIDRLKSALRKKDDD